MFAVFITFVCCLFASICLSANGFFANAGHILQGFGNIK